MGDDADWIMNICRGQLFPGAIEIVDLYLPGSISWPNCGHSSPDNHELAAAVRAEANYFERNAERMRYPEFRRKRLFVSSGVLEAGCKTVIGCRLKRSGMVWTVRGANAL